MASSIFLVIGSLFYGFSLLFLPESHSKNGNSINLNVKHFNLAYEQHEILEDP